ncbi:MAG TPA: 6,7-dimethyl-8-ribityllumazine synthase [Chryseosolibacter sp.]|nr:6,7-dimethyl-8-ribityllumazine synthase [Chryseosolibacter sp.]
MPGILKSGTTKTKLNLSRKKFAIIVASWNDEITEPLFEGAYNSLRSHGVKKDNIIRKNVPGTFELSLGAQLMADKKDIDAVICLGCVVQGDTPHFDYICQAVAYGITEVNIRSKKPVIFGVLTTLNKKQAMERAGGKYGNKGEEAAITAIQMLEFKG